MDALLLFLICLMEMWTWNKMTHKGRWNREEKQMTQMNYQSEIWIWRAEKFWVWCSRKEFMGSDRLSRSYPGARAMTFQNPAALWARRAPHWQAAALLGIAGRAVLTFRPLLTRKQDELQAACRWDFISQGSRPLETRVGRLSVADSAP